MEKSIHQSFQKVTDNAVVRFIQWVSQFWFKAILLYLGLHILFNKNVSIEFGLGSSGEAVQTVESLSIQPTAMNTTLVNAHYKSQSKTQNSKPKTPKKGGGRGQTTRYVFETFEGAGCEPMAGTTLKR